MKKEKVVIKEVSVDDISPNKWNPNEMTDVMYAGLKKTIRKLGLDSGIHVRKISKEGDPEKYEIIDGEHRWKAAKALGQKTISVIILDRDEYDAIIQMLNMNKIRGTQSSLKMAAVIASMMDTSEITRVADDLALSQEEITGLLEAQKTAAKVQSEQEKEKKDKAGEELTKEREPQVMFSIKISAEEYERILQMLSEMGGSTDAENLMLICDFVEEANATGK